MDLPHAETHTAVVCLEEFFAMNTIYNIDNTCNILEQHIQYSDINGSDVNGLTTTITIPNGAYNLNNLMNMINQKIMETYQMLWGVQPMYGTTLNRSMTVIDSTTVRGFGYFFHNASSTTVAYSNNRNPFQAACGIDTQVYSHLATQAIMRSPTTNPGPQFKVRFWAPCFDLLSRQCPLVVANVSVSPTPNKVIQSISLIMNNYSGLLEKIGFPLALAQNLSLASYKGATLAKGYTIGFNATSAYNKADADTTNRNAIYTFNPNASSPSATIDTMNSNGMYGSKDEYYGSLTATTLPRSGREAVALVAPTFPNLEYPRNIYVSIDSISTRNRCACRKLPYGSVFAKIPNLSTPVGNMGTTFGSYIYYCPAIPQEIYVPGLSLDSMTIRLYDDNGDPIQWNGGRWTITLSVKYAVDLGSAGMEDVTLGRTYRPYLKQTHHDPLETRNEFHRKRAR